MQLLVFVVFLNLYLQCCGDEVVVPNSHRCVGATFDVAQQGNGSHSNSCMSCDPTYPDCSPGCQKKIDYLYRACDSICLPDGYYFDPRRVFSGCWEENLFDLKIQVERCGCNAASKNLTTFGSLVVGMILLSMFLVI